MLVASLVIVGGIWLSPFSWRGGPSADVPRGFVSSLSYSADGQILAVGRTFGRIELWEPELSELRESLPDIMGRYVALSGDGSRIVAGDERRSGLYDIASGAALVEESGVCTVVANHSRSHAISEAADGRLIIWNLEAGTIDARLELDRHDVTVTAIGPDGGECAFGTRSGDIIVLNISAAEVAREIYTDAAVTALAFDDSGERLAGATSDGRLLVWHGDELNQDLSRFERATGGASRIVWLAADRFLLGFGTQLMLVEPDVEPSRWPAGVESLTAFSVGAGEGAIAVGSEDESEVVIQDVGTQQPRASLDVSSG